MRSLKFLIMLLTSKLLFVCCEPNPPKIKKDLNPVLIKQRNNSSIYTIKISARDWQTKNNVERFAEIIIPGITEDILKNGIAMVYFVQGDKQAVLPFNYYQVREIVSFEAGFNTGHICINVFGNFLMNIHEYYDFNIVVVSPDMLNKNTCVKWNNYAEVKKVFKIST